MKEAPGVCSFTPTKFEQKDIVNPNMTTSELNSCVEISSILYEEANNAYTVDVSTTEKLNSCVIMPI